RAQRAAPASSDFDDDELLVVAAHEIDLAEPATVTACEDFETVPLEMLGRARLPEPAALDAHSALAGQTARVDRPQSLAVERYRSAAAKLRERQHAAHASLRVERQVARETPHRQ